MPRRDLKDGGHTAFTDHKIQKRPEVQREVPANADMLAWREPATDLRQRNLGIAYVDVGMQRHSSTFIRVIARLPESKDNSAMMPIFSNGLAKLCFLRKRGRMYPSKRENLPDHH